MAQGVADFAEIKQAAHALKSSSANVAAIGLSELCQLMEVYAQKNDIELAIETYAKLAEEYDRVLAALKSEAVSCADGLELAQAWAAHGLILADAMTSTPNS